MLYEVVSNEVFFNFVKHSSTDIQRFRSHSEDIFVSLQSEDPVLRALCIQNNPGNPRLKFIL